MTLSRKLLFFPMLAVGGVVLVISILLKSDLPVKPAADRARLVEIEPLELQAIAPLVVGFGKVVPKFEWKAIAEVSGKVIYRHPDLEKGQILPADTVILKIDPLDYQLKLTQAEADLASSHTQLKKLLQEEDNQRQTLVIEKNRLVISNTEVERKQNLRKKGLTSQSDLDQQQQAYLSQKKLVLDIENQLALFPDEKKVANAVIAVSKSKVKEAQRALDKTTITLPQTVRIASVDIETNQVVNLQQTMLTAQGIATMEVEAQFSIHDIQTLTQSLSDFALDSTGVAQPNRDEITASIELTSGQLTAKWPAKVARFSESVDMNQATVGVILEIEQDYGQLSPAGVPALVNGMFVKAQLEGQANPSWAVPERALHGKRIYIMNSNNELEIRPVTILYRRDNQVVIEGGIEYGEQLVINDLLPAIEGMLLRTLDSSAVTPVPVDGENSQQGAAL
ncbi:acriflavin resistance protein [Vibrio sp. 10N.286.49.B3]|uniref:efflux RND transporter periplasmic adaptor subunit n=1 Tax=Vibrio sp. 10N.286.49.B3 TaxID=1880855 RepID=UPI000C82601B|nr:HlyD family secretion protein [Vibrio sp. 10N.286.49.B3]PMH39848.1 acriflavin resistance protein [Vibrio sp. 10N.286.49.B3]